MTKRGVIKGISLIIGIPLFIYWIIKIGPRQTLHTILDMRWWLVALLVNSFFWYVCYTLAWQNYFSHLNLKIPFRHLLKIRIWGDAISWLSPLSFVAGDPVRIILLGHHIAPSTRLGSVIVDRALHSLASVLFILIGILVTMTQSLSTSNGLFGVILIIYALIFAFLTFLMSELLGGRGLKVFHPLLKKLGLTKRFHQIELRIAESDKEFKKFSSGNRGPLIAAFIYHFIGRILGAVEIAIIFYYLDGSPYFVLSIMLASITTIVHLIFAFVPGAIGIMESVYGGLFSYYGFTAADGVAMQIIRRLRGMVWVGLALITFSAKRALRVEEKGA